MEIMGGEIMRNRGKKGFKEINRLFIFNRNFSVEYIERNSSFMNFLKYNFRTKRKATGNDFIKRNKRKREEGSYERKQEDIGN